MADENKELIQALDAFAAFAEDVVARLEQGKLRAVDQQGIDQTHKLVEGFQARLRALRSVQTVLATRTVADAGDFIIEDVLRQAAAIRRAGDEPAHVRMSPLDWGKVSRSPNALHMLTLGPPPTVSGIEILFDSAWDGPVIVEGRSNTPLRPTTGRFR